MSFISLESVETGYLRAELLVLGSYTHQVLLAFNGNFGLLFAKGG